MKNTGLKQWRKKFDHLAKNAKNILVVGHINPDADAVASCLAMEYYLKKNFPGKTISILLCPAPLPDWVDNFLNRKTHLIEKPEDLQIKPDLVIFLDGNMVKRFFPKASLNLTGIKTVCIDHHLIGSDKFDLAMIDSQAAATAQILARLFFPPTIELSKKIAMLLLIGILGDTGDLHYLNPANASCLSTVERLIRRGEVDLEKLTNQLEKIDPGELELVQKLIANTKFVQIPGLPPFTCSFLPKSVLRGSKDELINSAKHRYLYLFVRKIKGYDWGIAIVPQEKNVFSISLRSMNKRVNVAELAKKYFSGGGHARAAGGQIESNKPARLVCQETLKLVKKTV